MANVKTLSPAEVDNMLVKAMRKIQKDSALVDFHGKRIISNKKSIEEFVKFNAVSPDSYWVKREAVVRKELMDSENLVKDLKAALAIEYSIASTCEKEFMRRGGWTRFWIVTNTNGHIHSTMNCSTCFLTTQYAWLPDLSGSTDAEVVELAGMSACTICFPDAPVESLNRASSIEEPARKEARLEREKKAAEKAAKILAKGITNRDGSPVKLTKQWSDIHTESEAQRVFVSNQSSILAHEREIQVIPNLPYVEQMRADNKILLSALAFKRNTSETEQLEFLNKKANAVIKRDYR